LALFPGGPREPGEILPSHSQVLVPAVTLS
jgi:hypothetical protein